MSKIDEDIEVRKLYLNLLCFDFKSVLDSAKLIWTVKDKLRSTVITEKVNKLLVLNKQYNNYVDRSEVIFFLKQKPIMIFCVFKSLLKQLQI